MGCTVSATRERKNNFNPITVLSENENRGNCLKFSLKSVDNDDFKSDLTMLRNFKQQYFIDCQALHCHHTDLEAKLLYFQTKVHGVCVEEYSLVKGLEVFIIMLKTTKKKDQAFKVLKKLPFLKVVQNFEGEILGIIKAWKGVTEFFRESLKGKIIEKMIGDIQTDKDDLIAARGENLTKYLEDVILGLDRFIQLGNEMIEKINQEIKRLENFAATFPIRNQFFSESLPNLNPDSSSKAIVHTIFTLTSK